MTKGFFGEYGGRYVAETLLPALDTLDEAWQRYSVDPEFRHELSIWLSDYVGRPSRLTFAQNLTERIGGAKIYLKREDLNHTGAHKINNCIGQVLLAKRMGKTRIIAETGAGQHGVATATVAARFSLPCEIYMGAVDVERQRLNVERMRLLGAKVHAVQSGSRTLKDAMNEALRDWVSNVADTHYIIGSVAGPHPYPTLVRDLQRIIGDEARQQLLAKERRHPTACVACVGGGSNAIGLFAAFLDDPQVALWGVEAAGDGLDSGRHAATLSRGRPGVLHGSRSYVLCDDDGQILEAHSISAGLDYPGVGPEHAHLCDIGRVKYVAVTDDQALAALQLLGRTEGILCALETAHAVSHAVELAAGLDKTDIVLVSLSGRGDKDMPTVSQRLGSAQ